MNEIITSQRNMDDGYGTVYCVQKQIFELNNIQNYKDFEEAIRISNK